MTENAPELLRFFKVMGDATRLRMTALLTDRDLSGEQLAAKLAIRPATVSHHLARLAEAGLVSSRSEGRSKLYRLRLDTIHAFAERLLAEDALMRRRGLSETRDEELLANFSNPDGSLKRIPAQRRKLVAVLRHIVRNFVPDQPYTEKQVNALLERFHPDTATLRREMIACKLMQRDAGVYKRRVDSVEHAS